VPKLRFDVDINESLDPVSGTLNMKRGGSQDSNLELYDQVVKVGEGWVELEFVLHIIAGLPNE
jgi:hypothetical protein